MDNIYVYFVQFPCTTTREAVMPCADGYTIYIDARLDREARIEAFNHALGHIKNGDFERENVQEIETIAHRREMK